MIVALTACTTPSKMAEERDANGNKIEYVYYTPVGSNIPIKVRKDQLHPSEKDVNDTQAALREIVQQGRQTNNNSGGN